MRKTAFPEGCWIIWRETPAPKGRDYAFPANTTIGGRCVAQVVVARSFKKSAPGYTLRDCTGKISPEMGWWDHDWLVKHGARRCTPKEKRAAEIELIAHLL